MIETLLFASSELIVRLFAALGFGCLIGVQRSLVGKMAGMRTYALVSMGSSLFVLISQIVSSQYVDVTNFDPLRMASQVIVGIGFLGAGLIILKDNNLSGLTTAAGLWLAAGIGMACGFGLYFLALVATVLTLLIFTFLWYLENALKHLQ